MIMEFEGVKPSIHEKTFIAEGCHIIGKVTIKEYSSIWFNTVVRGDVNSIEIGRYVNIQDNSVVHVSNDYPTIIGDFVTIGHNATVHACTVEDHCLIGMGSIILDGAVIGRGSIVAAGALVKKNQHIPPFSVVAGIPAKVIKTVPEEDISKIHSQALKYKDVWTKRYGICPDAGGESYDGGDII
ncbi:MAG TPA: gamma carbonic anhydrase family protein [Sedimentibacter sp.]|jgi:carbonic anhydrase/acetyltransferase-like protein (isoleucine patch superfamily)|nr:gamma carbonic anhydrase family protein [Sedimentibacter sp.]HOK48923.1 gamma carbonic anhydrase family protein [Sedimentibacter sp.]HRC80519.1 gamma carbonic anhydrase family protein [Sedimentibacter sp.]